MPKKKRPGWILTAEDETCPGCLKKVEFGSVQERYITGPFPEHQRLHLCRKGSSHRLADVAPRAKVIICRVTHCDSARLAGEEIWHTSGKSFALQTERVVAAGGKGDNGDTVCFKHSV